VAPCARSRRTSAATSLDEVAPTARTAAAAIEKGIADLTTLDRAATLADVGNVAVFAASHWAHASATNLNITGGTVPD
jgi:3-oxoacyl-[acyl-carrier protein] reductase